MDDKLLDHHLKQGKKQAEMFFTHAQPDSVRKAVLHKVQAPAAGRAAHKAWRPVWKVGAAAACAVAAVCIGLNLYQNLLPPAPGMAAQEAEAASHVQAPTGDIADIINAEPLILDQPVSLDPNANDYFLSYYPVSFNHTQEPGLVTTLWQDQAQQSNEMVYSSVFEQSDEAYPVSILNLPSAESNKLMLISSGYSQSNLLHYRIVLYHNGAVTDLLAQDFVPGGSLGIQDGVVVEQRKATGDDLSSSDMQFSYIVPYIIDADGTVILPLESLHMHVGDMVILLGAQPEALEADSENGIAARLADELAERERLPVFVAEASGDDAILLNESNSARQSKLSLNITES